MTDKHHQFFLNHAATFREAAMRLRLLEEEWAHHPLVKKALGRAAAEMEESQSHYNWLARRYENEHS